MSKSILHIKIQFDSSESGTRHTINLLFKSMGRRKHFHQKKQPINTIQGCLTKKNHSFRSLKFPWKGLKEKMHCKTDRKHRKLLTLMSWEMLENSSLAFLVNHESPSPIFKLVTLVRAFSILGCFCNEMRESLSLSLSHPDEENEGKWEHKEHKTRKKGMWSDNKGFTFASKKCVAGNNKQTK